MKIFGYEIYILTFKIMCANILVKKIFEKYHTLPSKDCFHYN